MPAEGGVTYPYKFPKKVPSWRHLPPNRDPLYSALRIQNSAKHQKKIAKKKQEGSIFWIHLFFCATGGYRRFFFKGPPVDGHLVWKCRPGGRSWLWRALHLGPPWIPGIAFRPAVFVSSPPREKGTPKRVSPESPDFKALFLRFQNLSYINK